LVQVTQQLAMVWSLPLSHESICASFASIPTELHFVMRACKFCDACFYMRALVWDWMT
jgi:hypothetical protein